MPRLASTGEEFFDRQASPPTGAQTRHGTNLEFNAEAPWMPPQLVEAERRRLPEASFRRLFMGEWCAGEDALAVPSDVVACAVLDGPQRYEPRRAPYVVAVDLGVKRDRSVLVVAHAEAASLFWVGTERRDEGRRVVVDRKLLWKPSRLRSVPLDESSEGRALVPSMVAMREPSMTTSGMSSCRVSPSKTRAARSAQTFP